MSRSYVIIPAAGESRRMGQPKLLLPWKEWTLIDQVLSAWDASDVDQIVVVLRETDRSLSDACGRWPIHVVKVDRTPQDMKESVWIGMRFLQNHWQPKPDDRCFVAPADLPGLRSDVINRLLDEPFEAAAVTVPRFGDRQGHPVLVPWGLLQQIHDLPDDQGVNQIVTQNPQRIVSFSAEQYFGDVDTPQDYEQQRGMSGPGSSESRERS